MTKSFYFWLKTGQKVVRKRVHFRVKMGVIFGSKNGDFLAFLAFQRALDGHSGQKCQKRSISGHFWSFLAILARISHKQAEF